MFYQENRLLSNYLTRVKIYPYLKKIKIDISTIPVEIDTEKRIFSSKVSDEKIPFNKSIFVKEKNGILCTSFTETEKGLEDAEKTNLEHISKMFSKRYWYKFSFKRALEKRIDFVLGE